MLSSVGGVKELEESSWQMLIQVDTGGDEKGEGSGRSRYQGGGGPR